MRSAPIDRYEDLGGALALYCAALIAVVAIIALPVYSIISPATYQNPGIAAYQPAPGTRLIPALTRKMDAPPVLETHSYAADPSLQALAKDASVTNSISAQVRNSHAAINRRSTAELPTVYGQTPRRRENIPSF